MSKNVGELGSFILKAQTKQLFRKFMDLTREIEDRQQRKEIRRWIVDDFKFNKDLTNQEDIKLQLIRARSSLKKLEDSILLSRA